MKVLVSHIQIGSYSFRSITDVKIEKSVDMLTDTAVIKMPTHFRVKDDDQEVLTEEALRAGDFVTIDLGYKKDGLRREFVGYVNQIKPKTPLEIHCEDSTWLLKRKNIKKNWNDGVSLSGLVDYLLQGVAIDVADNIPELALGKYRINNANALQVLEKIIENTGISIYLTDNNKLYAGFQQGNQLGKEIGYDLNRDLTKNDLSFRKAEDRKIKIKYVYMNDQNEKTTYEFGDEDGDLRTYHTSTVSDPAKLQEMAKAQLSKLKYDGYDGSLTSFLVPYCTRGMATKLKDETKTHREGTYFVSDVIITYGMNGARRKVKIANRL